MQEAFPTPKPRKTIPERSCQMLILEHQGKILLEQQASPGIWGGLWSLPKFDDMETLQEFCIRWGVSLENRQRMGGLLHVFSHFRLHIDPWLVCSNAVI